MAVFRIEKTQNYTVMSNHHLRNMSLTLKAKGLMSQMLSLPDEWDYSLTGLAAINKESIDAIRTAVWELENAGYIIRKQNRDAKGRMAATEYVIYEQPQKAAPEPKSPILENSTSDNLTSDNPTQLSKDKSIKELLKKDPINPIPSPFPQNADDGIDTDGNEDFQKTEKALLENTRIDELCSTRPKDSDILRGMFDILTDAAASGKRRIKIAGGHYSPKFVRDRLLRVTDQHMLYVLDCLKENTGKIRNIKAYLLASLFNAPTTIDSYYTTLVAHDMAHGLI